MNIRKWLAAMVAALSAMSSVAQAQNAALTSSGSLAAPTFETVDGNGVDLLTGRFHMRSPVLSMGDAKDPQSFYFTWNGNSWLPNTPSLWLDDDWHVFINYDGVSEEFADAVKGTTTDAHGWPAQVSGWGQRYDYTQKKPNVGSGLTCYFTGGVSGNGWITRCYYYSRMGISLSFIGNLPSGGSYPAFLRYSYQAYGNAMVVPATKGDPGEGTTSYLPSGDTSGSGSLRIDYPKGFSVTKSGAYNNPSITIKLQNGSMGTAGASQTLQISTPNLSTSNQQDNYLRPKNTTQTMTDPLGRVWYYTFNNNRDMTQMVSPTGVVSTIGYDGSHRVTSYSNGINSWTYSYDFSDSSKNAGTTTATNPFYGVKTVSHLKKPGPATQIVDELSHSTGYAYDSYDRVTSISYPAGNSTAYHYDARGNVDTVTVYPNPSIGGTPLVSTATYESGCVSTKTCNKPLSITDPRSNTTDYSYDPGTGEVATITQPAVNGVRPQMRFTYAIKSRYYKDANGAIQQTPAYYPVLSQTSTCRTTGSCIGTADETVTSYAYADAYIEGSAATNLLPTSVTTRAGDSSLSATTGFTYDAVGNVLASDGPRSDVADITTFRYDAMRQLLGTIQADPGSGVRPAMRTTYNGMGMPILEEQGTVAGTSDGDWNNFASLERKGTAYDSVGRPVTVVSASGASQSETQTAYDALGRVACVATRMNPGKYPEVGMDGTLSGGNLGLSACALGDAGGYGPDRITQNEYDPAGQLVQIRKAMGVGGLEQAYASYSYTANGKQEYVVDAKGNRALMVYDGFDRLLRWYFPSKTGLAPGSFDYSSAVMALYTAGSIDNGDYEEYGYDANGNRISWRRRDGNVLNFGFDALNRMSTKTGGSIADTQYGYDLLGHQLSATYTSGGAGISDGYDALGHRIWSSSTMGGATRTLGYQYDVNGNRTRVTHPDSGIFFSYEYDALNRLTLIRDKDGNGLVAQGYDGRGRLTGIGRITGASTSLGYGDSAATPGYDDSGLLTSLTHDLAGANADQTLSFAYNPAAQIQSRTSSNDAFAWTQHYNVNRGYQANGQNQYVQISSSATIVPTYDGRGNLTSAGGTTYAFDGENRLISATGATNASLVYDPLGRLFQISGGSAGTTQFLYDGDELVAEYGAAGNLVRRYVHGTGTDDPLIWYEGGDLGQMHFLHTDHQGTVIAVSGATGAAAAINSYDPWGIPSSNNLGRFQYTGQAWLPELGLYHYKARVYSPTLGRFLQTDPVGYDDQINLYSYVGNDPINGSDPSGTQGFLGGLYAQTVGPGTLYDKAIAQPFWNGVDALANSPIGDPGVWMSVEQASPYGALPGAVGYTGARALQAVNRVARSVRGAAESEYLTVANPRLLRPIQGPAEMTGSRIKKISRDMRANGYNPDFPVTAAKVDERLILMDGHHRTDAAIRAGLSEIPVRVVPVTPAQAAQLSQDAAEAAALRAARRGW